MHYDTFLQEAFARGLKTHSNDLPGTVKKSLLLGTYLSAEHKGIFYSKAHNLGRKLCEEYDKVLQDCDVLVMPTIPKKAGTFPPPNASLGGKLWLVLMFLERVFGDLSLYRNTYIFL